MLSVCPLVLLFGKSVLMSRFQVAQFNVEHFSGTHNWYACSHARPTFCNVCRESLSGVTSHGLSCEGTVVWRTSVFSLAAVGPLEKGAKARGRRKAFPQGGSRSREHLSRNIVFTFYCSFRWSSAHLGLSLEIRWIRK